MSLEEIAKNDPDLQAEIAVKFKKSTEIFHQLEFQVLFSGEYDSGSALLSIHAGTGGVDAQDWAEILLRMYLRFCEKHNFEAKDYDWALSIAYNSVLQAGRSLMFYFGYRPRGLGQHSTEKRRARRPVSQYN